MLNNERREYDKFKKLECSTNLSEMQRMITQQLKMIF
nr:MAG TPA: hypothetical protein [Caudoviricetes sp.]DAS44318.1 MAG TPA: hypothetical protein [Caudoviricetes sp.]